MSEPRRRRRIGGLALGWTVSLALHGALVVGGFALVWSIQRTPDVAYATEARTVVFNAPALAPEPRTTPTETPQQTKSPIDQLFEPKTEVPQTEQFPDLSEAMSTPVDTPARDLTPPPPTLIAREAEFFGTGASDARRIVYVVDASGSTLPILSAVGREIARSLDALNATQFATILVAQGRPARDESGPEAIVLRPPIDGLIRATPKRARDLGAWFADSVSARGRSDLLVALREAMALEPDAIFLLATPGNASTERDGFLDTLAEINPVDSRTGRRRAIIAVVSVGPPPEGDPLLDIARAHGEDASITILDRAQLLEAP